MQIYGYDCLVFLIQAGVALEAEVVGPEHEENQDGSDNGQRIKAKRHRHADRRRNPQSSRRGKAVDMVVAMKDEAGSEKADASDNLSGHLDTSVHGFGKAVPSQNGKQRGTSRDQSKGPRSGRFPPSATAATPKWRPKQPPKPFAGYRSSLVT